MKKKCLFMSIGLIALSMLSSCNVGSGATNPPVGDQLDIGSKLFPNIWVTLAQIISFLVMVSIVIFFAYKPIKKNLDARKNHVEKTIKDAHDKFDSAKVDREQASNNLKESHITAQKIIDEAREVSLKTQNRVIEETNEQIRINKERAKQDLIEERHKMEREIHNEIINSSIDVSKEILGREINEEDNKKMVENFINQLKDTNNDK
ncbi:MAG: F0F1 ATP synthase subunit B [Bacilli bacterium]